MWNLSKCFKAASRIVVYLIRLLCCVITAQQPVCLLSSPDSIRSASLSNLIRTMCADCQALGPLSPSQSARDPTPTPYVRAAIWGTVQVWYCPCFWKTSSVFDILMYWLYSTVTYYWIWIQEQHLIQNGKVPGLLKLMNRI